MIFSPTQIGITFLSFVITLIIAIFWHYKDKSLEKTQSDVESFPVLMSVFFYSAFLALFLKMFIDLGNFYFVSFMKKESVMITILVLEELVKAFAIIVGLNIAGKRFNEESDGVMYAVFAALGFIFFENILYLLSVGPNIYDFLMVLLGRNIFSFAAHLSIIIFGLFYAAAYLHSDQLKKKLKREKKVSRIKPYRVDRILKFLWNKYSIFIILWIPLSPIILVYQVIRGKNTHITMAEMLLGGFIFSSYVHVAYDYLLTYEIPWLNTVTLASMGIALVFLYHFFPRLDVR